MLLWPKIRYRYDANTKGRKLWKIYDGSIYVRMMILMDEIL